jgi:hypothetical protein
MIAQAFKLDYPRIRCLIESVQQSCVSWQEVLTERARLFIADKPHMLAMGNAHISIITTYRRVAQRQLRKQIMREVMVLHAGCTLHHSTESITVHVACVVTATNDEQFSAQQLCCSTDQVGHTFFETTLSHPPMRCPQILGAQAGTPQFDCAVELRAVPQLLYTGQLLNHQPLQVKDFLWEDILRRRCLLREKLLYESVVDLSSFTRRCSVVLRELDPGPT